MFTKRPILSLVFSLSLITGEGALLQLAYADPADSTEPFDNGLSEVEPVDLPKMNQGPIDDYLGGPWLEFSFNDQWVKGCQPSGTGYSCKVGDNALPVIDPAWNFIAPPGGVKLTVTDAFLIGDVFEVYDFDNLIGTTSAIDIGSGSDCGSHPDGCLGIASSGSFTLSPGPHSITIKNPLNPFGKGAAYFRIDALDHLVCYRIKPLQKFKKRNVRIDNQFGSIDVQVIRPVSLCVPSTKEHLYENGK